jgi:AhpD family alkylhydroperoxidase
MGEFRKRTYQGPGDFLKDLGYVSRRGATALELALGKGLSAHFREQLMLVVTGVNKCRYCTYIHSQAARLAGLSDARIEALLAGRIEDTAPEERVALRYALAWAETNGQPDEDLWHELCDEYGDYLARRIELALRMIRVGNLTGNSLDRFAHYISQGRWGG